MTETIIFVDIDGVLNVSVKDSFGAASILFSTDNIARALKRWDDRLLFEARQRRRIEQLVAVRGHPISPKKGQQDDTQQATYEVLLADPKTHVSQVLVRHLAQILSAASLHSDKVTVVLCSAWRFLNHQNRDCLAKLEAALSKCLGKAFRFDACTALVQDLEPALRLRNIGDFLERRCASKAAPRGPLRVLVLEDLHCTALGDWGIDCKAMSSVEAVEEYLLGRVPEDREASVKFVHTYSEWETEDAFVVQVGSGLTAEHLEQALDFVKGVEHSTTAGSPECCMSRTTTECRSQETSEYRPVV